MTEDGEVRSHKTIHITVSRARHLKGHRGDVVTSFAKVEFDGKHLGDSTKVETSSEIDAEYNFTTSLDCNIADGNHILDDIASKPILVTITEVLPKEKKQKEEKSSMLGQCTIDLLPLLSNSVANITTSLELQPCPGSPLETVQSDLPKAEVDILVSVNEPLLDSNRLQQSNILTVRIGSLYSPPEAWTAVGSQYNYTIGLPVPVSSEKDASLIFANGAFKLATERELSKRKMKWHSVPNSVAHSQYITTSCNSRIPVDEEKGDFCGKANKDQRAEAESEKPRVTWDVERRCYLGNEAKSELQTRIAQTRLWPVEVMRTMSAQVKGIGGPAVGAGGKKDKSSTDDDGQVSFHGIAYVDLAPLLYPGVKSVAGAFKIHAFNESELLEKVKRKSAIADSVARAHSSTSRVTGSSPVQKGGKAQTTKEPAGVALSKKGSGVKQSESSAEIADSVHAAVNTEGCAYKEAQSFVYLEFLLATPMVPRREPEDLAELVREYIPPRPQFKRAVGGAQKAIEDYHSQLSSVAVMVLDEFRDAFGPDVFEHDSGQYPEMHQDRKRQLLYQLNSTGKYFAFKEQLKHSIVKIVREKYMKTTTFKNKDDLHQFLSELYVYLVDEMHLALQKVLSVETVETSSVEPFLSSSQLKMFAEEAEVNGDLAAASKYYQERLAIDEKNPDHWFDFGSFNLLIGNNTKGKECFKEAVALQQSYIDGLLMYGIMCTIEESYIEAEAVFERATSLAEASSQSPSLAWTILALFYDIQGNEIRAEHSYSEASKINKTKQQTAEKTSDTVAPTEKQDSSHDSDLNTATGTGSNIKTQVPGSAKSGSTVKGTKSSKTGRAKSSTENSVVSNDPDEKTTDMAEDPNLQQKQTSSGKSPAESVFLHSAKWLLDRKALRFAENALSHELLSSLGSPDAEYYIALARLHMMRKNYQDADKNLQSSISLNNEHPDAWSMKGHLNYVAGNFMEARDCYERTLAFVTDASETHAIYLRLGSIYLQEEQFSNAKRIFLLACKHSPTCLSWFGVGVACYRLGEIEEAEDALAEANILNNKNAEVWAYLSLVCLKTNRKLEAEQSYKNAIKLGITDDDVLNEVHQIQTEVGFGNPSF